MIVYIKKSICAKVLILTIIFQIDSKLYSQNFEEIQSVKYIFETDTHALYNYSFDFENEYRLFINNLFVFYKRNISPFDFQSCGFYPSCSVYAIESVEKKGILLGIIATFDRLSRCNGISPEKYEHYKNTKYLYDPVD